jgi:quercetin dioxygenase-like cupin family protein
MSKERSMPQTTVSFVDLPLLVPPGGGPKAGRHLFEGASYGLSQLTVVVGESHPGQSVQSHQHDFDELVIIHAGEGTYTVGTQTVVAGAGEIVVIPARTPHHWINHTDKPLVHTGVFPTPVFAMEQVED